MQDLLSMQRCNLLCLPENYQLKVRMIRISAQFRQAVIVGLSFSLNPDLFLFS